MNYLLFFYNKDFIFYYFFFFSLKNLLVCWSPKFRRLTRQELCSAIKALLCSAQRKRFLYLSSGNLGQRFELPLKPKLVQVNIVYPYTKLSTWCICRTCIFSTADYEPYWRLIDTFSSVKLFYFNRFLTITNNYRVKTFGFTFDSVA